MRKIITLVCAAALPIIAISQTDNSRRLTDRVSLLYNSGFQPVDSAHYHYATGRGYDTATMLWQYDSTVHWSYMVPTTSYQLSSRDVQTFNGSNNITGALHQVWDAAQWADRERITYTYTNGDITVTLTERYAAGQWKQLRKTLSNYNSTHQPTLIENQSWNDAAGAWEPTRRTAYTYANNMLQLQTVDMYDNTAMQWVNGKRTTYAYDGSGNNTGHVSEQWNTASGVWEQEVRVTHTFDANNDRTQYQEERWDATLAAWVPIGNINFTFDNKHHELTREVVFWDGFQFQNLEKTELVYNAHGQLLKETTLSWDNIQGQYLPEGGDQEFRYYYEEFPESINKVAPSQPSVSAYPIPAGNMLYIRIQWQQLAAFEVSLYDMAGRMVEHIVEPAVKDYSKVLNTTHLPAGSYRLEIGNATQRVSRHISIVK